MRNVRRFLIARRWLVRILALLIALVIGGVAWIVVFRPSNEIPHRQQAEAALRAVVGGEVAGVTPNDYHPYLVSDRWTAFRLVQSLHSGFVCEPQAGHAQVPRFAGLPVGSPVYRSGPADNYYVGGCISRSSGVIRLSLWGDDAEHVFEVEASSEGARSPDLLARLARAAAVAAAGSHPPSQLVRWLISADKAGDERRGGRFTSTVVESSPTSRTISIAASDTEPLARLAPPSSSSQVSADRLARTFAPVLHYSADDYLPLSLTTLRSRARLCVKKNGEIGDSQCRRYDHLPSANPCGAAKCPAEWVLDIPNADERQPTAYAAIESEIRRSGSRPVVYWHVARIGRYRSIIQYWIYYLFNDFLNVHEGDWETVQVDVVRWHTGDDVAAVRWFFSSHENGQVRSCSSTRNCAHPDVYVAVGSHANYFEKGSHQVDVPCNEHWPCYRVPVEYDHARDDGETLTPDDYKLVELIGPGFSGFYGPGNYKKASLSRLPFEVDPDAARDPRERMEWQADPLASFAKAPDDEPSRRKWYVISLEP